MDFQRGIFLTPIPVIRLGERDLTFPASRGSQTYITALLQNNGMQGAFRLDRTMSMEAWAQYCATKEGVATAKVRPLEPVMQSAF